MTTTGTEQLVRTALHDVAPDADVDGLGPQDDIRDVIGLDSLDFLQLVELLSERTGHRIDEEDYSSLATLQSTVEFLRTAR